MLKNSTLAFAAAVLATGIPLSSADAAETLFVNRALFLGTLGSQVTDSYSPAQGYPAGFSVLSDAAMSAAFGETDYQTTGFTNNNIVGGAGAETYCAGCNGSFRLTFTSTSVGTSSGVFGAGLDILFNSPAREGPYSALVLFGDSGSATYALGGAPSFFGITSDRLISSITFGPNPSSTRDGTFGIDNLTIGSRSAVPEPATWGMMFLGFGLVGGAMRYRRRSASLRFATA